MNQAPEHFLAGPAFAEQEHGNIYIGHERGLGADLAHLRAGRDEEHVFGKLFDFSAVGLLSLAEAEINDGVEFRFLKRLGQVVEGAQLHRVHDFARVVHAGQHDDLDAGLDLA